MSVSISRNKKYFKLDTKNSTYMLGIADNRFLGHMYYGKRLYLDSDFDRLDYLLGEEREGYLPSKNSCGEGLENRDKITFEDTFPWEFSVPGYGDFGEHCLEAASGDGKEALEFIYEDFELLSEKPELPGLPATFRADGETLVIRLREVKLSLTVKLMYSVFEKEDAIAKSVTVYNDGEEEYTLSRVLTSCLEFPEGQYDLITLHGAWGREREPYRRSIGQGKQSISSIRGVSSHQENPFMAIVDRNATEETGSAYGISFVYSGNFLAQTEMNQFGGIRAVMGIHPYQFAWKLMPGESFTAPEVVHVFSSEGIGGMTRCFHDLYREHLIRSPYWNQRRPVLINNWEATYFNFDTEKLWQIAEKAAECGIEMLVMDDGWFGYREDDSTSLGDWSVNEKKLPGGLKRLVEGIKERGLKFGIWLEPEMVSPDSDLYREHSDWIIGQRGRSTSLGRNQYVLDFSRKEVRDEIYRRIAGVLKSADISYVKWDMNRSLTNVPEGEKYHRYVLGVYDLQNRLVTDFPDLLLENCSSGGGRYDAGMLYYSPQIWCSDDTDAIERLSIQRGTAMVYPLSTMGAHVSDCPNHGTKRTTPFETRGQVALAGTFGYELDVTQIAGEEQQAIHDQVECYYKYNDLIRSGDYYRLPSAAEGKTYDCYMVVSKDKTEALISFVRITTHLSRWNERIYCRGLDEKTVYLLEDRNTELTGSVLMNVGIDVMGAEDEYYGKLIHLVAKK